MPEDVSLDAFASSAEDDEDDAEAVDAEEAADTDAELGSDPDPERPVETDVETDSEAESAESVEPAVSTYAWSPEGAACADCGESVEKRWRAEGQRGGGLVCEDCKKW